MRSCLMMPVMWSPAALPQNTRRLEVWYCVSQLQSDYAASSKAAKLRFTCNRVLAERVSAAARYR